ncbi:9007_t:CDS:2 [Paraglomus brasilianum]|uniref:9007_t:CDS:1 n=1 Tax=Paraglomus brasilianum TaxID=144538 RepID=A0A9N9C366_9GLOM|nr:9007_t:CDS:2 [Paraglomus brasilianum]
MKNLVLNHPERIIRYKWIVVVIVYLAFWNMVDYNINAFEVPTVNEEE